MSMAALVLLIPLVSACGSCGAEADVPPPSGTVGDVIGINEAIGIPTRLLPALAPEERLAFIDERISQTRALGVRHVRLHNASYPFLSWHGQRSRNDHPADEVLRRILDAKLEPLVIIGPWPGNAPAAVTHRYLPDDLDAYGEWVTATVERYDGDGVGDAPALSGGIHLWEVDNEPDLHNRVPPRGSKKVGFNPKYFSTPTEYAQIWEITHAAIVAADPTAKVLPAGLAREDTRYSPSSTLHNIHIYRERASTVWLAAPKSPELWITEVSTPSIGSQTEQSQAIDLANLFLGALGRGVQRLYWHSLVEPPDYYSPHLPSNTRGRHLLVGEPGDVIEEPFPHWRQLRWKRSAWTLKHLLERFGEVPRSEVEPVPTSEGFALRIGTQIAVYGDEQVTLEPPWPELRLTRLVPGDGNPPSWYTEEIRAKDTISIDLSTGPVLLESLR